MFCGAFGYADDLILLCPSVYGLQKLINKCVDFADNLDMKFNTDKSKVIVFHATNVNVNNALMLKLGETVLDIVDKVEHLGHVLSNVLNDSDDISIQMASFNKKTNVVMSDFKGTNGLTRFRMLQTYCYSFYGCQLWQLQDTTLNQFGVLWRKACRKALMIPPRTHNALLPLICNTLPFDMRLKFVMSCLNSNNNHLQFITLNALNVLGSTCGVNIRHLMNVYGLNITDLQYNSYDVVFKNVLHQYHCNIAPIQRANSHVLRECIDIRDGMSTCILDSAECNAIIKYIATD
jgi:hypothetical protein